MERQQIETALVELALMLEYEELTEPDCQDWFERHDAVFKLLGFKEVLAHPRLQSETDHKIPDFLVKDHSDIWSIFEIKRPDTKILKSNKNRDDFYQSLRSYISQCHKYNRFFDDESNRKKFNEQNNVEVQKNLKSIIIAGINEGLDKNEVHSILFEEGAKVSLQTYSDVYNNLQYNRSENFAKFDNIPGITIGIVVKFSKIPNEENYLFEFGRDCKRNKVSVYIDKFDRLALSVFDDEGRNYLSRINIDNIYTDQLFLCFEVGATEEYSTIILEYNGQVFQDIVIPSVKFDTRYLFASENRSYFNFILGTNLELRKRNNFQFTNLAIYGHKMSFEDKYDLRKWYWYSGEEIKFLNMHHKYAISCKHQSFPQYFTGGNAFHQRLFNAETGNPIKSEEIVRKLKITSPHFPDYLPTPYDQAIMDRANRLK